MKIGLWSTTPGSNNSTPPDGWPEGQAPSTVNDCAREMMAQIKTAYVDGQWVDHGMSPTYVNSTTFTVPGNQLGIMQLGRQLKLYDGVGPVYRSILSASFTTVTTVSVNGGASITTSLSSLAVCVVEATNAPWSSLTASFGAVIIPTGILQVKNGNQGTPSVYFDSTDVNTGLFWVSSGIIGFACSGDQAARLASTGFVARAYAVTSDARTKSNWQPIPEGMVAGLAAMQAGSYTRNKDGTRALGVPAQDLAALLPESTYALEDGTLVANYGPAAMVACVALATELQELRAEIAALKARP